MRLKMANHKLICYCLCILSLFGVTCTSSAIQKSNRSFTIDYEGNTFLKDGEPFRYISGSIHYFRMVEERWDDVLRKAYLAGLNTVQTYLEWSSHQPTPSAEHLDFEGNLNVFKFLDLAQKNGLNVILRPGPFIDAERDMGGLPPWLLWQKPGMKLRTADLDYVYHVARWFDKILPRLKPYLYINGGPIIMVQVENEYGSYYACDRNYTAFLKDLIQFHLGEDVVLFTTDGSGAGYLKCGTVNGTYPTVDFGPASMASIIANFGIQKQFAPKGPSINSEFYPGWLDHWRYPHSVTSVRAVANSLESMLQLNASVNIYMFYGGTSFGFGAGSNQDSNSFSPCPTSYDYDAPLTEAGDPTEKYFAIKNVISKFTRVPAENPEIRAKMAGGPIKLEAFASLLDRKFLEVAGNGRAKSDLPLSFEDLKVGSGFMLYETVVEGETTDPAVLSAPFLKDRAYIFAENSLQGIMSRSDKILEVPIWVRKGTKISILVENQGRPCYGSNLDESKGLGSKVLLGDQLLKNWIIYKIGTLNGTLLAKLSSTFKADEKYRCALQGAGFYHGNFVIENDTIINDTFIRFDGWRKGMIWVNGFNLGRYWPVVGPQETLYLPAPLLQHGRNKFIVLELESSPQECRFGEEGCHIILTDTHVINGTTPLKEVLNAGMLNADGVRLLPKALNEASNVQIKLRAEEGITKYEVI